ncbi:L domain-like protein [Anaeromyces robustus]|uniref:L domain-like protein n=1 Tax=Anaeromyces robustus TaxID=1754192 RepID=A0A1Y1X5T6_9FUNG|nr:L domain-like protein [Anaeromyces robustus]|eukprot:ORX81072.1 L domain-like protein [Anaeromyces robustus]
MSKKSFIFAIFVGLITTVLSSELGNISFYGRGQASLATHWCSVESIRSSTGVHIYFPEEDETQSIATNNKIRNYPMIVYMPGKGNKNYSYINFSITNQSADLLESSKIKAELRISAPSAKDLIDEGYTCESIGLTCTNLTDYNFSKNEKEWLSKVDLRFYIESDDIRSDPQYDDEEVEYFRLQLSFGKLSTSWKEYVSQISFEEYFEDLPYREYLIRNYGSMPVNVHIGNTFFLKSRVIPLLTNGAPASGYSSYSWLINGADTMGIDTNDVYPDDNEKKIALIYSAVNKNDYAYYVHNSYSDTYGPPEAISFRIRSFFVNNFKLKIDNIKEFNLTTEYSIPRNCKIPNEEEVEILVDVRSLIYADSYHMVNNDITGFLIQAYTDNDHVKDKLVKQNKDEDYINSNTSKVYFYSFNLHNTYPTNLKPYTVVKYDSNLSNDCDISMHDHADWKGESYQWPTVISSVDKYYKLIVNAIDDSELNSENDLPDIFTTANECENGLRLIKRLYKTSTLRDKYSCDKEKLKLTVGKKFREDIISELDAGKVPEQLSIISLTSISRLNCSIFDYINIERFPYLKILQITNSEGLNCEIPDHIGKLKNLQTIDLKHNKLTGTIPESIGNLENLEILDLSYNELKGEMPINLNNLKNLKQFDVSINDELEGEVLEKTLESCNYLNTTICHYANTEYCYNGSDECPESTDLPNFSILNYQISFTLNLTISFILCLYIFN